MCFLKKALSIAGEAKMDQRLVTVETYRFLHEAEAARIFLDSEGIQVYLADVETVTMDWMLGVAVGHIKLQVAEEDANRAQALLWERAQNRPEASDIDDDTGEIHCLQCQQLMTPEQTQCPKCGWSYREEHFKEM